MIYVCVTTKNAADTVGLLLWKVRQVFLAYPKEYQFLVTDDGSSDDTPEVLERYQRVLPMTLVPHDSRSGYGACTEALLLAALERSDRPKRDSAIVLPPDFTITPDVIPEAVKRIESGADVVIGESRDANGPLGQRLVRRAAPWLLRPGVQVPGVADLLSGFCALRLITLKLALRHEAGPLLQSDGLCARAELVARATRTARQVAAVPVPPRSAPPLRPDVGALGLAVQLYRLGRRLPAAADGRGEGRRN